MWTKGKFLLIVLFASFASHAQIGTPITYKQQDTVQLQMDVCYPLDFNVSETYPAVVFFHGGGWRKGNRNQFAEEATYFSNQGFISFLVEYRIASNHQSTPFDALTDAKSVIRHIRAHAETYQIDPHKVIVIGSSAGGQLALGTAFSTKYDDPQDPKEVSAVPNGIILYNPILDTGPGAFGYGRIKDEFIHFSPLHTIKKVDAPVLLLLGTSDRYTSVSTAELFVERMKAIGNHCELILYPEATHGLMSEKLALRSQVLDATLNFLKQYQ